MLGNQDQYSSMFSVWRGPFAHRRHFLAVSSLFGGLHGRWELPSGLFYKGTHCSRRQSLHDWITSRRPQLLMSSSWWLDFNTWIWGWHKHANHSRARLHSFAYLLFPKPVLKKTVLSPFCGVHILYKKKKSFHMRLTSGLYPIPLVCVSVLTPLPRCFNTDILCCGNLSVNGVAMCACVHTCMCKGNA
jgi:hypothetical protein